MLFGVSAMREHKLRSGLTILGIVVGVATVIAMVAIVTGFNNNVIGNFQAFGASRIEFMKYKPRFGWPGAQTEEERRRRNLTMDDVLAIRKACRECAAVSALVGYFDAEIHAENGNLEANNPYVLGADEYYPTATAYMVVLGRFFTPAEVEHGAPGVVLGADVREAIFPSEHPIGKEITVNGLRYRVIGVLEKKGEQFGYSPDNKIVVPYKAFEHQFTFQVRQDGVRISAVPRRPEDVGIVIEKATEVLRARRRIPFNKANDFEVNTPDQLIGQFRAITGGVTGAMILIALISLVVGGVGVMNIMLVSVTQRTREIGDPEGGRRVPARHRAAVPHGGHHFDHDRGDPGRRVRRLRLGPRASLRARAAHLRAGLVGPRGSSRLDVGRPLLRHLSRREGLAPGPHRSPPLRIVASLFSFPVQPERF